VSEGLQYLDTIDEHCSAIYLEVPSSKVVLFQSLFETYEGIGLVRTLSIQKSLICILTTQSMAEHCFGVLEAIQNELPSRFVSRPVEAEQELFLGYFRRGKRYDSRNDPQ
jgi:hypothetical protein